MNAREIAREITGLIRLYPLPRNTDPMILESQLKAVLIVMKKHEILEPLNTKLSINFLTHLRPPMNHPIRPEPTTVLEYALERHILILSTFETSYAHDKFFDGLFIQHRCLALFLMSLYLAQMVHEDIPFDLKTFRAIYNHVACLPGDAWISVSDFFALHLRVLQKMGIIDKIVQRTDDPEKHDGTLIPQPSRPTSQSIFTCVWDTVMGPRFPEPQVAPAEDNQVNTQVETLSPS